MEFDFNENSQVDSLSKVPEKYQGLYNESQGDDGSTIYTLSDTAKPLAEAYMGQTAALNEARNHQKKLNDENAQRRTANKAFTQLASDLGLEESDDIAGSLKGHVESLQSQIKGGEELKINLDKIKTDYDKRLQEALDSKDAENAKMKSSLEKHLVGEAATKAISDAKGSSTLLLPIVKDRVKVVQDGEDYVVRVVDNTGDFRSDGKGGWMTVSDLVSDLKSNSEFARAFESEAPSGNNSSPGSSNRPSKTNRGENKSSTQKIADGLSKMRR